MTALNKQTTREEQVQAIYDLKVGYTLCHADIAMLKSMARQLLAGLEQEPVAYMYKDRLHTDARFSLHTRFGNWSQEDINEYEITEIPLYAAPQLPQPAVVVDERAAFNAWNNEDNLPIAGVGAKNAAWLAWQARATLCGNSVLDVPPERPADSSSGDDVEAWFDEGWNACRAAMLQGAEPVSQPDELPMDYQQGHKDGLEWAARLAEANHPQTGDWLYDDPLELAKAIRKGPDMPTAPVQGWIPCSERMPEEIGRYWCYVEEQNSLGKSHYQWNCSWNGDRWWVESENGGRVTHWMPLPEPPKQNAES